MAPTGEDGMASNAHLEEESCAGIKRENDAGEEEGAGAGDAKRAKVEEGESVAAQSPDKAAAKAMLPAPPLEEAEREVEAKCGMRLTIGSRLDVLWEVGDDGEEDGEATEVWWHCAIDSLVGSHAELGPMFKLKYQPKVVDGATFPAEERIVTFSAPNMLVDTGGEKSYDEEESRIMQWRLEGTTPVLDPLLPAGTTVCVRPSAPPAAPAGDAPAPAVEEGELGVVAEMYSDGTYLVALDDGGTRDRVPRNLVEAVDEEESDEVVAASIDSFFELFIASMTGGAKRVAADKFSKVADLLLQGFKNLAAEKQRMSSRRGLF
ncbi:hypothetical protein T484DRAFT_1765394 [Baffinella frigidus]|nr:hypothetical protein T484DRAFT_1765394 [Cryptophyta sp. CCMP2293]